MRRLVLEVLVLLVINAPGFIPGIDFSDHLSYWEHGYPAVMVTDTAFYRNPRYHTVDDTPDTLDYERMALVVDGLVAAVRALTAG
ncbi:MAG: M28 family peptidase [Deltaproteobacteria bacterium]|nr:MAG: M28 family peptidase [Deltaproteobacteria bacterium]